MFEASLCHHDENIYQYFFGLENICKLTLLRNTLSCESISRTQRNCNTFV